MRHIVFDTETTGFYAEGADRIVEIGALELVNFVPTGQVFHHYINPERPIPAEVVAVHGITDQMVADKPIYAEIVGEWDKFIGTDGILVAHNAEFDMRFINAEYKRLGLPPLPMSRAVDTLAIARKMFPGAPASLDALCKRYEIDTSARVYHGALLDARLLADVFLQLSGGHQPQFLASREEEELQQAQVEPGTAKTWSPRVFAIPPEEQAAHESMLALIKDAIWNKAA